MAAVSVRYFVDDMDEAVTFYCDHLGFAEVKRAAPRSPMLTHGDLRLLLSVPGGGPGGARRCPTARCPRRADGTGSPWRSTTSMRRLAVLDAAGARLPQRASSTAWAGVRIVVDDPAGNPVELVPADANGEARLDRAP